MSTKHPRNRSGTSGYADTSDAQSSSGTDPIRAINKRNRELEKRTFRALGLAMMLGALLALSVIANVVLALRKPSQTYFAQDTATGTLTQMLPLDRPVQNKGVVTQTVADAIAAANSIDFLNWRRQLLDASVYFTPNGWKRYESELQSSGTLEAITKRSLVLSGVITEPPVIVDEGLVFGAYFWDVQVPYRVRWVGSGFSQTTNHIAKVKVVRVPTTENPRGVGIAQFISSTNTQPGG